MVGEDILPNLRTISIDTKKIKDKNVPNLLEVRCEIYISKKDFQQSKIILLIQEMRRRIVKTKRSKRDI